MCGAERPRTETLPKTTTDLMPKSVFCFQPCCAIQPKKKITHTMNSQADHSGIRIAADNPNHHLWNNHGTWFLHYTVHPTPFTKERIRRSLGTKDLGTARLRRDAFFAHFVGKQAAA
jgi:hypothetical protein